MAFTYNSVGQQVTNIFGQVAGVTAAAIATNYNATLGTGTVKGPDFFPLATQDAILATIVEIVTAIAETLHHPGRIRYGDFVAGLASGQNLPFTGTNTGQRILGLTSRVTDSATGQLLLPAPVEKINNFNRFAATVYAGKSEFWYALLDRTLYHTRSTATMAFVCFDRPNTFSGNVPLDDAHETPLVMGAVRRLALKENMFAQLHRDAKAIFDAHIADIKSYKLPEDWTTNQGTPSNT